MWNKVNEKPKKYHDIDVWTEYGTRIPDCFWDGERFCKIEIKGNRCIIEKVTHWMYTPSPPKQ